MDKIATENLFLLEFLVDKVELSQKCQCDAPPGETCVSFQFLDNAPLDVCEADFAPKRNYRDDMDSSTKSGKSCLFSLSPDQADICLDTFDIVVTIWKKMLPGWLPEKIEIGQALISIANLFAELINSVEASDGSVPTAKTLKDDFEITSERGDNQGKITVYIRMSCFGKLIITQFQMNLDEKSVLFKDKEGKSLYRYKKAGKGGQGGGGGGGACTARGRGGMDFYPASYGVDPMQGQYGGGMGYNSGCPTSPCGIGMGDPYQAAMGGDPYGRGNPYGMAPLGQYGMGNTGQYPQGDMGNSQCPFSPCNRGNGSVAADGAMAGNGSTGGNENGGGNGSMGGNEGMPANGSFVGNGQGAGGNGSIGGGVTMITPCQQCGGMPNPPCMLGSDGKGFDPAQLTPCQQCGRLENPPCGAGAIGAATPCIECACNPDAPCLNMGPCLYCPGPPPSTGMGGQPPDPNKEVFVLKIGKKKEGTDKKPRMELELVTPKAPVVKPIPKLETRDTQYDAKDVNGKKGKGKGKDKKGKKGKKK